MLAVDATHRLKIAGTNTNAVCLMMGVVTECLLIDDGMVMAQQYPARKVTIVPFAQEMRRDTSLWGQLFGFRVITASVSAIGMSFLTMKQGALVSNNAGSAPSTPRKKSNLFKSVASPIVSQGEGSRAVSSYRYARNFDEKGTVRSHLYLIFSDICLAHTVPIYDGRPKTKPFTFSAEDFRQLPSWPLYKKGNRDLPADAVVAIGYTLNTYSSNHAGTVLSSNVQFAILLALPL